MKPVISTKIQVNTDITNMKERGVPSFSIIIPTRNSAPHIARLFGSLSQQTFENFEIIVVDTDSQDNTWELVQTFGARLLKTNPLGNAPQNLSIAKNIGAQSAQGKYLLFLDSDMELPKTLLETCDERIQTADALCIKEQVPVSNYWANARGLEKESFFGSLYFEAARCIRKSVFDKIGGYDPQMTSVEDIELQARLVKGNFRIDWISIAIIHHEEQLGLIEYLSKRCKLTNSFHLLKQKHPKYWKNFISTTLRLKMILNQISRSEKLSSILLIPGLVFTRSCEFLIRML